jgi:hypothetical protein
MAALQLVDQRPHVSLQHMPCGSCWLGHSLTGETVLLRPRGQWLLNFSGAEATKGQGFVRPQSALAETQWCNQLFRYAVYASAQGEVRMLDQQAVVALKRGALSG